MFQQPWPRLVLGLVVPVALLALLVCAGAAWAGVAPSLESPDGGKSGTSSSALALTPDGATLLVVNPDSNSLSLLDTAGRTVLAEISVGLDPRTVAVDGAGQRAFVANYGSDTISVIDITSRQVIADISVGDRPYGVVADPHAGRLYVAEQGSDRLAIVDTGLHRVINTVPVPDRPSGLALAPADAGSVDGGTLYVSHLLNGTISVLNLEPHWIYRPLLLRAVLAGLQSFGFAQDRFPISNLQFPAPDFQPPASKFSPPLSTIPLFPDSNLVQSIVLSPDGRTAYVPHTRSNTGNRALTFDTTLFPLVSLLDLEAGEHLVGWQLDLGTLDPPGVGLPFDAALTPDGAELWVLNAASNDVSVIDLASGGLVAHVEVGDNPRGIVLSPDGATAYVDNTLVGTVSVINTAGHAVSDVITVTNIPLPPALLRGKQLFFSSDDPRLSRAQWISCNSCHYEGEHDGRTWFFGFAGPRNTTSLLGMVETYPLRWSGEWDESADSEFVVRKENFGSGLIDGDLNCTVSPADCIHSPPNQGRSYDLDCLALYIDSLQVRLSPAYESGALLGAAELRGRALFFDPALGCLHCHPPPLYTDLRSHDVGTATADERIGSTYDTPTLRGLFDSAPYLHDGSAATLYAALTRPTRNSEHDVSAVLTEEQIQDLISFLLVLPYEQGAFRALSGRPQRGGESWLQPPLYYGLTCSTYCPGGVRTR